jgi:hypothetical protein
MAANQKLPALLILDRQCLLLLLKFGWPSIPPPQPSIIGTISKRDAELLRKLGVMKSEGGKYIPAVTESNTTQ